ncbi:hypothetical protein L873DRAFT_602660 [Choiromyces venosus 120613-1]|uniref:Uncharacterized protein n=1 Tax=Choiromyces venosus 120613-1 TaxID=1336337 RepID=A0A3N4JTW3_9PEZI|nr:hypothetical protein L873DRAFT_602660 [Choiromyces venosus 120613-1]
MVENLTNAPFTVKLELLLLKLLFLSTSSVFVMTSSSLCKILLFDMTVDFLKSLKLSSTQNSYLGLILLLAFSTNSILMSCGFIVLLFIIFHIFFPNIIRALLAQADYTPEHNMNSLIIP